MITAVANAGILGTAMLFEACPRAALTTYAAYLAALSSPIDSFLEDHILASDFFRIRDEGGAEIGFYAMRKDGLLTQFHLIGPARRHGQRLFAEVVARGVTAAFVPTCDECFLSHALDVCSDVKKQAYFFADPGGPLVPGRGDAAPVYAPAREAEGAEIRAVCGDFLEPLERRVSEGQIFVGRVGREIVGLGIVEHSRLTTGRASIGMFTAPAWRQRGIATRTLQHLMALCRGRGWHANAGCWYYNHNSKRSLEAAGMVTTTRLLRLEFAAPA